MEAGGFEGCGGGGEFNYHTIADIIGRLGKSDIERLCGPTETSVCETAKVTQGQHTHTHTSLSCNQSWDWRGDVKH